MASDHAVVIAVLAALPPTIAALSALVVSIRNQGKIAEVHLLINSRMNEMLAIKDDLIKAAQDATLIARAETATAHEATATVKRLLK